MDLDPSGVDVAALPPEADTLDQQPQQAPSQGPVALPAVETPEQPAPQAAPEEPQAPLPDLSKDRDAHWKAMFEDKPMADSPITMFDTPRGRVMNAEADRETAYGEFQAANAAMDDPANAGMDRSILFNKVYIAHTQYALAQANEYATKQIYAASLAQMMQPQEMSAAQIVSQSLLRGFTKAYDDSKQALAAAPGAILRGVPDNVPAEAPAPNDQVSQLLATGADAGMSSWRWWIANAAYAIASSSPMLGGALVGGMAGAATPIPGGALIGAGAGSAIPAALQTYIPKYREYLAEGQTPDEASRHAMEAAGLSGAIGAALAWLPGWSVFGKEAVKDATGAVLRDKLTQKIIEQSSHPLAEAMTQMFALQPATMMGQEVLQGYMDGRLPTADDLKKTYAMGVIPGVLMHGAHSAVSKAFGKKGEASTTDTTATDEKAAGEAAGAADASKAPAPSQAAETATAANVAQETTAAPQGEREALVSELDGIAHLHDDKTKARKAEIKARIAEIDSAAADAAATHAANHSIAEKVADAVGAESLYPGARNDIHDVVHTADAALGESGILGQEIPTVSIQSNHDIAETAVAAANELHPGLGDEARNDIHAGVQGLDAELAPPQANTISRPLGQPYETVTPDGTMKVMATPQVVDLSQIQEAKGAEQPRDRSTKEMQDQERHIASTHDVYQTLPERVSDSGAPSVYQSGTDANGRPIYTLLAGTGRTRAARQVYERPELAHKAKALRDFLGESGAGHERPFMVNVVDGLTPKQREEFAAKTNGRRTADMGVAEQGMSDAHLLGHEVMGLYHGGSFNSAANEAFARAFLQAVTPNERQKFSEEGKVTETGEKRMQAAVLAAAYGDKNLVHMLADEKDVNVKTLATALRDAAGPFIQLKRSINEGTTSPKFDIGPSIVTATKTLERLREKGIKVKEHFAQQDAFARDPIADLVLKYLFNPDLTKPLRQQSLTEFLKHYAKESQGHGEGLFADQTGVEEVLGQAYKHALSAQGIETETSDIFGAAGDVAGNNQGTGGEVQQPLLGTGGTADQTAGPVGQAGLPGSDRAAGAPDAVPNGSGAPTGGLGLEAVGAGSTAGRTAEVGQSGEVPRDAGQESPANGAGADPDRSRFQSLLADGMGVKQALDNGGFDGLTKARIIDAGIADGTLRVDRHGNVKKTAKGNVRPPEAVAPKKTAKANGLAVSPDERANKAIESYEHDTNRVVHPRIATLANRIEAAIGDNAAFAKLIKDIKKELGGKDWHVGYVRDLANLVGNKVDKKASKAQSFKSIIDRHEALVKANAEATTMRESFSVSPNQPRELDELGHYSKLDEVLASLGPKDKVTAATLLAKGVKANEIEARGLSKALNDGKAATVAYLANTADENPVGLQESIYQHLSQHIKETDDASVPRIRRGPPRHQNFSVDPHNRTYAETVVSIKPKPVAEEDRGWTSVDTSNSEDHGHWRGSLSHFPEESDDIGHHRTLEVSTTKGERTLLADEIQSDAGQSVRDDGARGRDDAVIKANSDRMAELNSQMAEQGDPYPVAEKLHFFGYDSFGGLMSDIHDAITRGVDVRKSLDLPREYDDVIQALISRSKLDTEYNELLSANIKLKAKIPNHPLLRSTEAWLPPLLRSILRRAVERNVDGITITPGEEQGRRYAISQKVKAIRVGEARDPERPNDGVVFVRHNNDAVDGFQFDKEGILTKVPQEYGAYIGKPLSHILTKGVAKEVIKNVSPKDKDYKGAELDAIQTAAMQRFYDDQYPKALTKLLRKIDPTFKPEKREVAATRLIGKPVDYFPLTEKIKDAVRNEGLELFSKAFDRPEAGNQGVEEGDRSRSQAEAARVGGGEGNAGQAPRELNDSVRQHLPEISERLHAYLSRMLPRDIAIRISDRVFRNGSELEGVWSPQKKLIELAMRDPASMEVVGRHETIHALRQLGLFTREEWGTLVDTARATIDKDLTRFDRNGAKVKERAWYEQNYRRLFAQEGIPVEEHAFHLKEMMDQEFVARLAELHSRGKSYGPKIDAILERIKTVIRAVRQAFGFSGFETADSIFKSMERGTMAARRNRRLPPPLPEAMARRVRSTDPQKTKVFDGDKYTYSVMQDGDDYRIFRLHPKSAIPADQIKSPLLELGKPLSEAHMNRHEDGSWETGSVRTPPEHRRKGFATDLYAFAEKYNGRGMRPSGVLMPDGHAMWAGIDVDKVKHHRQDPATGHYLSPKQLLKDRHVAEQNITNVRERIQAIKDELGQGDRDTYLKAIKDEILRVRQTSAPDKKARIAELRAKEMEASNRMSTDELNIHLSRLEGSHANLEKRLNTIHALIDSVPEEAKTAEALRESFSKTPKSDDQMEMFGLERALDELGIRSAAKGRLQRVAALGFEGGIKIQQLLEKTDPKGFQDLLTRFAETLHGYANFNSTDPVGDGFRSFWQQYVVRPHDADHEAPDLVEAFSDLLEQHNPGLLESIDRVQEDQQNDRLARQKAIDESPAKPQTTAAKEEPKDEPASYTGSLASVGKKAQNFSKGWRTRNFQPELFSDDALRADPRFAKYVATTEMEVAAWIHSMDEHWHFFNKMPVVESRAFIRRMELNQAQPTPKLAEIASLFKKFNDWFYEMEKRYGSKSAYVLDYFAHIWDRPDEVAAWFKARMEEGRTPEEIVKNVPPKWFQEARMIDLIDEGIAKGFKLISENPSELMAARGKAGIIMRNRMELLHQMRDLGLAIAHGDAERPAGLIRQGWAEIDAPNKSRWLIKQDMQAHWANSIGSVGLRAKTWFRAWMQVKNTIVPIKLMLSAFHVAHVMHINMAQGLTRSWLQLTRGRDLGAALKTLVETLDPKGAALGGAAGFAAAGPIGALAGAWAGAIGAGSLHGFSRRSLGGSIREASLKPTRDQTPFERSQIKIFQEGGFTPHRSHDQKVAAEHELEKAWNSSKWLLALPRAIQAGMAKVQAPIFDTWIPNLKAQAYLNACADRVAADRSLLDNDGLRMQAFREIAKSIDNRFGEMNYDGLFWNKTFKDAGIASFLSMGWNLGFLREFGGAATQPLTRAAQYMRGTEVSAERSAINAASSKTAFALIYLSTAAMLGGMINKLMSGDNPESWNDLVFPRIGGVDDKGSPRRVTTPFYLRELPMAMKHIQEKNSVVGGLGSMVFNKMMYAPFIEFAQNKDYYGTEIYSSHSGLLGMAYGFFKHFLGDSLSPMSITGASHAADLSGHPFPSLKDAIMHPVDSAPKIAAAANSKGVAATIGGFAPAPAYASETWAGNRTRYLFGQHVAPAGGRPLAEAEDSNAVRDAKNALRMARINGDDDTDAYQAAIDLGIKPRDLRPDKLDLPSDLKLFKRLPASDQREILEGIDDEKEYAAYLAMANRKIKDEFPKQFVNHNSWLNTAAKAFGP